MTADQLDTFDGERVLWVGRPTRFPVFDVVGILLTAVGIYSIVGAAFAIASGIKDHHTMTVILAVLVVLCVLAVVIGRPLFRRSSLRSTQYVLTESRIVICSKGFGGRKQIVRLRDLDSPTLSMREGARTGTIRFDDSAVVLLEIENARQVHQLIASTQADAP